MSEVSHHFPVLDQHLGSGDKKFICGDEYTIADMAILPWIQCFETGYNAKKFLELDGYKHVQKWRLRLEERKAVQRGMRVNGFRDNAIAERHSKEDFSQEDY